MKKLECCLAGCLLVIVCSSYALATPVDLSTFIADPAVTVSNGVVTFVEDPNSAAVFFANDNFSVDLLATSLTFDYSFNLMGSTDIPDSFVFLVNNVSLITLYQTAIGQSASIDLTPYLGQQISLAWGLIWGGEDPDLYQSTLSISNIDVGTSAPAPVPEPSTIFLFSTGLAGLIGFRRRRNGQAS